MTARDRLALVLDENENAGDESGPAQDSTLEMQLAASNIAALTKRVTLIEGRLRTLESLESITARHGR